MKRSEFMKGKIKLWLVIFLCNVVAKFYGKSSLDGFIHSVDFSLLNEKYWNIRRDCSDGLRSARLKKHGLFGICLFEKKAN